jgi:hypothetical protein
MKVVLLALVLGCVSAHGQDQAMQAAQQATQDAMQASQQALQTAMQTALQGTNEQVNHATTQKSGPVAPLPAQFLAAKKVFISNRGSEEEAPVINGSVDLPYDEFYAFIHSWGKYELVTSPNDADLIFEIGYRGQLHLVIFEPKTHVVLWTFNQGFARRRQKDFDQAMVSLVDQLKGKAGAPLVPKSVPAQKHLW